MHFLQKPIETHTHENTKPLWEMCHQMHFSKWYTSEWRKICVKKKQKITRRKMCQQMQLWVVENCCWGPISAAGARHLPLGHSMRGEGRFLIFSKYFYLHLFIFNFFHFPLVTLLNFVHIVTWISPSCSMDFSKLIHEFL